MIKDLTVGRPSTTILRFALPVIGGNLFQLFYTLADTVIVGRTMGADALAAVGATGVIIYFILCFVQGFTGGFGICLGQRFGAKDAAGMRRSVAAASLLSLFFTLAVTPAACLLSHPILRCLNMPERIYGMAYDYMFVVLLGTGATVFYNVISNMMRALGDSKTLLYLLIFSSLLNIALDIIFIVPLGMGTAGAAWATVLSQLISALFCTVFAVKNFEVMRLTTADWHSARSAFKSHLAVGLPMGLQFSVMCIGLIAMQAAVNGLGPEAIAGFTAATKVDQLSVLVNTAFGIAISGYVAQNYGARFFRRIRAGVRACLMQLAAANILMGALMIVCRERVVPLFVENPGKAVIGYSNDYLLVVVPFYLILGVLVILRAALQSMDDAKTPFAACAIELVMRVTAAFWFASLFGYRGICFATPLAWIGAASLLVPVYLRTIRKFCPAGRGFVSRLRLLRVARRAAR